MKIVRFFVCESERFIFVVVVGRSFKLRLCFALKKMREEENADMAKIFLGIENEVREYL